MVTFDEIGGEKSSPLVSTLTRRAVAAVRMSGAHRRAWLADKEGENWEELGTAFRRPPNNRSPEFSCSEDRFLKLSPAASP
jgi:hypothetical protein